MQGKCVPGCEENVIGMIFYRYMITTGLLLSLSDIASAAFWKYIGQPYDFDAPQVGCRQIHQVYASKMNALMDIVSLQACHACCGWCTGLSGQ